MTDKLPGARAALVDNAGVTTPPFYRYFQALERLQAGTASAADVAAINAQIAAINAEIAALPKSSFPTLQVSAPLTSAGLLQNGFAKLGVTVANSVAVTGNALQLSGDAAIPGNTYLYSTSPTGVKGWNALGGMLAGTTNNIAKTVNADGTVTFNLAPVTDSGAGAFKLITRDSFGRLSGTKSGTTSDVPEGVNLYHTAARVLATLLTGLSTATNAAITAADTVLSALGKLQAQITANVAALTSKLTASNNLSDIANNTTAVTNLHTGFSHCEVNLTVTQTGLTVGTFSVIKFNNVVTDSQLEYSAATGVFTAKSAGIYLVSSQVHTEGMTDGCDFAVSIFVNGTETKRLAEQLLRIPAPHGGAGTGGMTLLALNANDQVTIQVYMSAASSPYADGVVFLNYMSIWRLT